MSSFTKKRSLRGVILRLTMLVALLVATAPGGLIAVPQTAADPAPDIYGYVTDGSDPVEGATVWVDEPRDGPGPPLWSDQAVTDENGLFEFYDAPARDSEPRFTIQVYASGFANGFVEPFAFDGAQVQKDVVLTSGDLAITGTVYDEENEPVGDLLLFLHVPGEPQEVWNIPVDANGEYSIYALPDPSLDLLLDLWVQGYHPVNVEVDYEGTLITRDIHLVPVIPYFNVNPQWDNIHGYDWEPGADLDITIGDGVDTFKSLSVTVEEWGAFFLWGHMGDLEGFDIEAGHVVTVEDAVAGVTTTHTVTELRDVAVDIDAGTVSGFAEAGSSVTVNVYGGMWGGTVASRDVTADVPTGSWTADFSVAGLNPDEDPYDIEAGMEGSAVQADEDLNATYIAWFAEEANPHFNINVTHNGIWGHEWPADSQLDITVDDAGTVHEFDAWTDGNGDFELWELGELELEPGQEVEVTDGETVRTHTVLGIYVSDVDVDADTITGGGVEPDSMVAVDVHDEHDSYREVQATSEGLWEVDYSVEGPDGQPAIDIVAGVDGNAHQRDEQGNGTFVIWHVENPRFSVNPVENGIWGEDWPADVWLTVFVGETPTEDDADWFGNVETDEEGRFDKWYEGDTFSPGDLVTVDFGGGQIVKEHRITSLTVDDVDVDANTVSGTADPDAEVRIEIWEEGASGRTVIADEFGGWTADFDVEGDNEWEQPFDIQPGTHGAASEYDEDQDATVIDWRVAAPHFIVNYEQNVVWGHDWPQGNLSLTVEYMDGDDGPFISMRNVIADAEGNFEHWFDEPGDLDLKPGDIVTVSDNDIATKSHTIAPLVITDVNPVDDVITGTTDPHEWVEVAPGEAEWPHPVRRVQADEGGNWVADFGNQGEGGWHPEENEVYDISFGEGGWASQRDDDGDATEIHWSADEVYVVVEPEHFDLQTSGGRAEPIEEVLTVTVYMDDAVINHADPVGSWTVEVNEDWITLDPEHGDVFANEPFEIGVTVNPQLAGLGQWTGDITLSITLDADEGSLGEIVIQPEPEPAEPIVRVVPVEFEYTNAAPVAVDNAYSEPFEWQLIVPAPGVLGNDTDADDDPLTAELEGDVAHGTLVFNADGSFTYTPDADFSGKDTFNYRAFDGLAYSNEATVEIMVGAEPADPLPPIIKGNDRYLTAIAGSKAAFADGAPAVVIATGENFADALGGAGLAGALDSPLLLTQKNALPSAVAAEIRRLGATKAYILGGTSAVSNAVADAVRANLAGTKTVTRLAGSNRYQTAERVAAETIKVLNASGGYSGDAFIATGANFPDALGASPIAASQGMPVFLADPARTSVTLPASVKRVWITGGTAVVSAETEASLKRSLGNANVKRLAGNDRFATAAAVARFGVGRSMHWNGVGITTGMNFPDALAAGPVLGSRDAVMLLTDTNSVPAPTSKALGDNKRAIDRVTFFGGDAAVPPSVRVTVNSLIR